MRRSNHDPTLRPKAAKGTIIERTCCKCGKAFMVECRRAKTLRCPDCQRPQYDGNYGQYSDLPADEIERRIEAALLDARHRSRQENWLEQCVLRDGSWIYERTHG